MPNSHLLKNWIPVSALFHLTLLVLAALTPWPPPRPADVMIVDLADLPRSADFPTPRPGILEGARPKPPPPSPPKPARKEKPPVPPPRELVGRVPDLPVTPALPPAKEFPIPRPKAEAPPTPESSEPTRVPRTEETSRPPGEPSDPP